MTLPPICGTQKGKRLCRLRPGLICPVCCGEARQPDACGDCEFYRPPVSGKIGPTISISSVATLGTDSSAGQYYLEHQFNLVDGLSRRWGRHQFKFGFDIGTIHVISKDRLAETFTFSNLTSYLNTVNHVVNPATGTTNWTADVSTAPEPATSTTVVASICLLILAGRRFRVRGSR